MFSYQCNNFFPQNITICFVLPKQLLFKLKLPSLSTFRGPPLKLELFSTLFLLWFFFLSHNVSYQVLSSFFCYPLGYFLGGRQFLFFCFKPHYISVYKFLIDVFHKHFFGNFIFTFNSLLICFWL